MNGDRIPKALESLRSAIRELHKCNSADHRKVIPRLASAPDATAAAHDLLALEYEATVDHLYQTVTRARQRVTEHEKP